MFNDECNPCGNCKSCERNYWIKCSDRLPNKSHQDVLITDGINISIAHIGNDLKTWFDDKNCCDYGHICHPDITYWQPLPEPPKEN